MPDLHPNLKLWIYSEGDEGVFGHGKVRLLEEIDSRGSLCEAAKALSMSYRKAWGDLKKAEACLQVHLIETTRGGPGGGNTVLTDHGRQLIKAYKAFDRRVQQTMNRAFAEFLKHIVQ
jgi:molybdate transport repressor ModE-like protein